MTGLEEKIVSGAQQKVWRLLPYHRQQLLHHLHGYQTTSDRSTQTIPSSSGHTRPTRSTSCITKGNRVLPPSQMPCTQMSSEGLVRKEIDVRCPAKSTETPYIPWSTCQTSSPLVAVTTSTELFPAAASTEGPLAPPVEPLIVVQSDMPSTHVSSEGLMGRKSNVRCPAKSMEFPSVPPSTALASYSLVVSSEQFPAAASPQATLATPIAPVMVLLPSERPCAHVSSEGTNERYTLR